MDENEEMAEAQDGKPGVNFKALLNAFLQLDNKDPRKIGMIAVLVLVLFSPMLLFSSSEQPSQSSTQAQGPQLEGPAESPAAVYVPLSSGKSSEFMATINEVDKILTFSAVLGLEKAELQIDVEQSMAPLLSEILRFLSDKTKVDVLKMIQDEEGVERSRLLNRLNNVLSSRGVDLNTKGMIVSISFTRYFFPPL